MREQTLNVGVIGMGHVGPAIASTMRAAGATIVGVSAYSAAARERADVMLPGVEVLEPSEVARQSQVLFVAVPDSHIAPLVEELVEARAIRPGSVVVHLSGALGTEPLESAANIGALTIALHPVMTFSGTSLDILRLLGCPIAYTCSAVARPVALALIQQLGGEPVEVAEEDRSLYHAALAHVANHLVTLIVQGSQVLGTVGIDEPADVMRPLVEAATIRALEEGIAGLTGPVSRGDMQTLEAHVSALERIPELSSVAKSYRAMVDATRVALHGQGSGPRVVHTREALIQALAADPRPTALVMTMGALHEGHLELVRAVKTPSTKVVVTIFVNPEQFGPGEDFEDYPRTLEADVEALADVEADIVYAPAVGEVYPRPPSVHIEPGPAARTLEGYLRPGHFQGVLQVVGKVMNLVRPQTAVFGQKDAQQFVNIAQMVADLDVQVRLIQAPIVRAEDGLALSSRNAYLSEEERHQALALHEALTQGVAVAHEGGNAQEIVAATALVLSQSEGVSPQYVALADTESFNVSALWTPDGARLGVENDTAITDSTSAYLLVAAKVGSARLIDNVILEVGG